MSAPVRTRSQTSNASSPQKARTPRAAPPPPPQTKPPTNKKQPAAATPMEDDVESDGEEREAPRSSSSVPQRFAGKTLYEVLSISKDATADQVKKAYRRAALTCHPDLNKSPQATEEFQYLSRCHEILADATKRKQYDVTGSIEGAESECEGSVDAYDYWRTIFPKISLDDIEAYRKKYEGGAEEKEDLLAAYAQYEGDLQSVFESVPFASGASVSRLCAILNAHAGAKLTRKQIAAFQATMEELEGDEAAEAEEAMQQLSAKDRALLKGDATGQSAPGSTDGLALVLAARAKERDTAFLARMESKYKAMERDERKTNGRTTPAAAAASSSSRGRTSKRKAPRGTQQATADEEEEEAAEEEADGDITMGEPSEAEFAAIQARIMKNKAFSASDKKSTAKKARRGRK